MNEYGCAPSMRALSIPVCIVAISSSASSVSILKFVESVVVGLVEVEVMGVEFEGVSNDLVNSVVVPRMGSMLTGDRSA